jgi:hypothetical protein
MSYYQGDPPHWRPEGAALFVTRRLNGSRPRNSRWLADPRIARYTLRAPVIMRNHVHILILPNAPPPRITKSMKNYKAHGANAIVGRIGSFWLEESSDRWVRTDEELKRIVQSIEINPVAVDLCDKPEDWRWSSAHAGREACATRPAPQGAETRLV